MTSIFEKATTPARRIFLLLAIATTVVVIAGWIFVFLYSLGRGHDLLVCLLFPLIIHVGAYEFLTDWGYDWQGTFAFLMTVFLWSAVFSWLFAMGKITPKWERFVAWIKTGK
jgi:hypothetical protein